MINSVIKSQVHEIYLPYGIDYHLDYSDVISTLNNCTPDDEVVIHCTGHGGDFNICLQLLEAIEGCQATTKSIVSGLAQSAHGIIAMACDEIDIGEFGGLMIHSVQNEAYGTLNNVVSNASYNRKSMATLYLKYFSLILTDSELTNVENGIEFYINCEEFNERSLKAQ